MSMSSPCFFQSASDADELEDKLDPEKLKISENVFH